MVAEWYYIKNETQVGPIETDEISRLIASGQLSASDMVWKEGMGDWVTASKVMSQLSASPVLSQTPAPKQSVFGGGLTATLKQAGQTMAQGVSAAAKKMVESPTPDQSNGTATNPTTKSTPSVDGGLSGNSNASVSTSAQISKEEAIKTLVEQAIHDSGCARRKYTNKDICIDWLMQEIYDLFEGAFRQTVVERYQNGEIRAIISGDIIVVLIGTSASLLIRAHCPVETGGTADIIKAAAVGAAVGVGTSLAVCTIAGLFGGFQGLTQKEVFQVEGGSAGISGLSGAVMGATANASKQESIRQAAREMEETIVVRIEERISSAILLGAIKASFAEMSLITRTKAT
jgi:hypothetical protein